RYVQQLLEHLRRAPEVLQRLEQRGGVDRGEPRLLGQQQRLEDVRGGVREAHDGAADGLLAVTLLGPAQHAQELESPGRLVVDRGVERHQRTRRLEQLGQQGYALLFGSRRVVVVHL